ncbi:MAG: cytochrome c oxidase subunit II [Myxococcota bacterium]
MSLEPIRELLLWLLALPPEVSTWAVDLDGLHFVIILVTLAGALGIGVAAVYFIVKYRRRNPTQTTPRVAIPPRLELVLAGALLSFFIASWGFGYRQYTDLYDIPGDALEIYVTGKQWMWKFAYPDGRSTAGVLVVPRNQKVKLLVTSRDVVHSFYVPVFRIKQDAVPGRYTSLWFEAVQEGTYRIFCAEYCGQGHSQMWGLVVVLGPSDYARWLEGETPGPVARAARRADAVGGQAAGPEPAADLVSRGVEAASRYGCLGCHTLDGQDHVGPTFRGLYGTEVALADGTTVVADEDYLTMSMMEPLEMIVRGYDPVMPSYAGVIDEQDVAPLVELIKSLRKEHEPPAVRLPETSAVPGTQGRVDAGRPEGAAEEAP